MLRRSISIAAMGVALWSCRNERPATPADGGPVVAPPPSPPWYAGAPLGEDETFVLRPEGASRQTAAQARAAGLLVVDLGDEWAPFIFSESDGGGADGASDAKPNQYRRTFVALANNRTTPDEIFLESADGRRAILVAAGLPAPTKKNDTALLPEGKRALNAARRALKQERGRNFLEVFGIPPTLSVLLSRIDEDSKRDCHATLDLDAIGALAEEVTYQTRELARRQHAEALADETWMAQTMPDGSPGAADAPVNADPQTAARLDRYRRGQVRLRAIRATQARLACEGLLAGRFTDGMFDHATHAALALWERKNHLFGWGFLSEETRAALRKSPAALHFETFRRILMERVADAAGIVEDGSSSEVPNLIGLHTDALLAAMKIGTADEMGVFLRALGTGGLRNLQVALPAPPLPPYHGPKMDLSVEIDRGDVWYDFPWDAQGQPIEQRRTRYPQLMLFVKWNDQKILLARWRTTIGSWRSELHSDGQVYYKYKDSDTGPRIWKNIVAAPVWIPPEGTPARDLLTMKTLDRQVGPVPVVNTDVMGPGFQSAYGLAMAIHLKVLPGGGLHDNQIRTHGSVDYTSIARRFSHGCHRLVNNRAVRLFGFVLRHRPYARVGQIPLGPFKRTLQVDGRSYEYVQQTRGYYFELKPPMPVMVHEGRVMGPTKKPLVAYMRKPGVVYAPLAAEPPSALDQPQPLQDQRPPDLEPPPPELGP